jgi:hypothetical protein
MVPVSVMIPVMMPVLVMTPVLPVPPVPTIQTIQTIQIPADSGNRMPVPPPVRRSKPPKYRHLRRFAGAAIPADSGNQTVGFSVRT